ncbi:hypothetical protein EHQ94_19700 [Leptospira meyeri]|uniref:hypothetical protein n=1 Tax=Leptospira meyeri TaxID=29508 RepID=UPI0010837C8C|nr:hypothetical protein [Leptospira meyeri]TGM62988.1 hypothetical protein EHQ94_19700 [Leptospira meyeri]TGM68619.1 hypothetical protein EHQ93_00185 [Leptospira meyeri]
MTNEINFEIIRHFLAINNWTLINSIENKAEIWRDKNNETEVILPVLISLRDYEDRISQLIQKLSTHYQLSNSEISNFFKKSIFDLISIQLSAPDLKDGTIPVNDGVNLFNKAKEMIIAAGMSTLKKKKYFGNYRPEEVLKFVKDLRLGQTKHGSYIINIFSVNENLDFNNLQKNESFSRKVLNNLNSGITNLKNTSVEYLEKKDINIFEKTIEQGVSANLCDAISSISGEINRDFTIKINLPSPKIDETVNNTIEFNNELIPVIKKASEFFKQDIVEENYTIIGHVTKLHRDTFDKDGHIAIQASIDGNLRVVKVFLIPEDYSKAINAHKNDFLVSCTGDLYLKPRSVILHNVRNIKVFDPDENQPKLF